jgi:hypothetical protein
MCYFKYLHALRELLILVPGRFHLLHSLPLQSKCHGGLRVKSVCLTALFDDVARSAAG